MPEYQPDVVLLDIGLSDIDGWELAAWLRRQESAPMIVAITAYQSMVDRKRSVRPGPG